MNGGSPNLIPLNSPIHSSDLPAEGGLDEISLGEALDTNAEGDDSKQLQSLLQPVSEGSECFLAMVCLCCGGCVLAPIICLAAVADNEAATIAGIVLLVLGVLFCCWGMWPVLLPAPEAPADAYPLVHPTTITKPKKVYVLVNPMGGVQGATGIYDQTVAPIFQVRVCLKSHPHLAPMRRG